MTDKQLNILVNTILDDGPLEVEDLGPIYIGARGRFIIRKDGEMIGFFSYRDSGDRTLFYFMDSFIDSNGVINMLEWLDGYKVIKGVYKKMVSMLGSKIPKVIHPQDLVYNEKNSIGYKFE